MCPVLEERMMRYETERLSFSLLALCGDNLAQIRQKLAANIRSLADLYNAVNPSLLPSPGAQPTTTGPIHTPTDPRLSAYKLDAEDIQTAAHNLQQQEQPRQWDDLEAEQEHLLAEYAAAEAGTGGGREEQSTTLGRTRDYTGAVHEWVRRLTEHGVLKRLNDEVKLQSGGS